MKKSLFILLITIMVILPYKVNAAVGNVNISCSPSTVKAGESFKCVVTGKTDVEIIDVSAEIKLSNNLIMESFELNDIWEGSDFDTGKIDIYTKSGDPIKSDFTIGTINVKVKDEIADSDEIVSLTKIEFTYDKNEYSINDVSTKIRVPSNVNTLSSLMVSGTMFTFKETTTNYNLEVDAESTTISATKKDENSVITGDTGNKTLKYGMNTFTITVTSEDGTKKDYTLNITRPDNRSTENDILSFGFIGYDIKFDKNKTDYSINVENDVSKLGFCNASKTKEGMVCHDVLAFRYSDKSTVKFYLNETDLTETSVQISDSIKEKCDNEGNCKLYLDEVEVGYYNDTETVFYVPIADLNVGKNVYKIVVTAENETEKAYSFTINRKNENGDIVDSPPTGDSLIIVICILAVVSLIVVSGVYFYRRNKKITN